MYIPYSDIKDTIQCQNSDIVQNFKVLKSCKQSKLYTLESILIEEEQPILNTQISSMEKQNC